MTIFNRTTDVPDLLNNRLVTALRRFDPTRVFSNDYLWSKLLTAESDTSHDLRVFLEPTEILPYGYLQSEADAITAANPLMPIKEEPGYDYDPSAFDSDTWGTIQLRQRPVIALHSLKFAYPSVSSALYEIPPDWIRLDRKYGTFALIPTQSSVTAPLSGFILSSLGGGRVLPYVLQVRYRAGLANARADYPGLVDLIFLRAGLSVVNEMYVPGSMSTSIDGMSQSISYDIGKMQDDVKDRTERLRKQLHGVRMVVC